MRKPTPAEKRIKAQQREAAARYMGHRLVCASIGCGSRGEYYLAREERCDCDYKPERKTLRNA